MEPSGLERGLLRGIAAFRWLAWVWMATVLLLARRALERPVAATLLVGAALMITLLATWGLRRSAGWLLRPAAVGTEVGVALTLLLADGFVYARPHVFEGTQPLGVGWPLAGLLTAGVAFGPAVGAVTGVAAGLARAVSSVLNVVPAPGAEPWLLDLTPVQGLSLVTTTVLYALAGGVAGYGARLLRDAERRVATAESELAATRERESLARRLHDGVLQTLAVVERRTDDPALARLAREQERELRAMLIGLPGSALPGSGWLGDALRAAAGRLEEMGGPRVEVLLPDDLPSTSAAVGEALVGAASEALTNVGKHAQATRVVVYAEPTAEDGAEAVLLTVRDDGVGFAVDEVAQGLGLARSVRARVEEVGGAVEVVSRPGRGTEVRLWVPAGSDDTGG